MRAAIYFTPPPGNPICHAAASWLGRSAFDGEATRQADPDLDPLTAKPARYGFHATVKAPFRLASQADLGELDARLHAFCASREPVAIEAVAIRELGPFFALAPDGDGPPALMDLEQAVVRAFDPFRAPLGDAERAARAPERLTERQRAHLDRWGYPHVFEDFRFHMTLTGPVEPDRRATVRERLDAHFAGLLADGLRIDQLALFVEPETNAPFRVHSLHPFAARQAP